MLWLSSNPWTQVTLSFISSGDRAEDGCSVRALAQQAQGHEFDSQVLKNKAKPSIKAKDVTTSSGVSID